MPALYMYLIIGYSIDFDYAKFFMAEILTFNLLVFTGFVILRIVC
jgi:hypothetical protein